MRVSPYLNINIFSNRRPPSLNSHTTPSPALQFFSALPALAEREKQLPIVLLCGTISHSFQALRNLDLLPALATNHSLPGKPLLKASVMPRWAIASLSSLHKKVATPAPTASWPIPECQITARLLRKISIITSSSFLRKSMYRIRDNSSRWVSSI